MKVDNGTSRIMLGLEKRELQLWMACIPFGGLRHACDGNRHLRVCSMHTAAVL